LWVRTLTGRFAGRYTGQAQVLERPGARWVGELALDLPLAKALELEAFLARVRGPALPFLFPDLLRDGARGSLKSMDAYAAEIGPTDFDDGTGFDDGHVFREGDGTPSVLGGREDRIALDGFAPFATGVLLDGDPMQLGPGRAHLALGAGTTDVNGYLAISITPRLREPPLAGALVTSGITILMRLAEDDAAENPTARSGRGQYAVALVEAAGDSITGGGST
jgi:hypothetical protein